MIPFPVINIYGNIAPEPQLKINQLIASDDTIFILYNNGELYGMGTNTFGQLGQGNNTARYDKFYLVDTNVKRFASVTRSCIYQKNDNSIWNSGISSTYYGYTDNRYDSTPVRITAYDTLDLSKVKKIQTNMISSCILFENGDLYGLGRNQYGELGTGNKLPQNTPVLINTLVDDISGNYASFSYLKSGNVYAAGYNAGGNLGSGNTSDSISLAMRISGVSSYDYSYSPVVIKTTGEIYCTGYNTAGQLGINSTANSLSYVQTASSLSNFDPIYGGKIKRNSSTTMASFGISNGTLYSCGNGISSSRGTTANSTTYSTAISPIGIDFDGLCSSLTTWMWKGKDIYFCGSKTYRLNDHTTDVLSFELVTVGLPY